MSAAVFSEKYVPVPESGCWLWTGAWGAQGYGRFVSKGERWLAHRYSWFLSKGQLQRNKCVCHKCDTPACVNPEHLFIGTNAENTADRERKGRGKIPDNRGEKSALAKLTEDEVKEIFFCEGPQRFIAKKFGVSQSCVGRIKQGRGWKHLNLQDEMGEQHV